VAAAPAAAAAVDVTATEAEAETATDSSGASPPNTPKAPAGDCADFSAAISVFWSGGSVAQNAATEWALANGGSTLNMLPGGKAAEAATRGLPWSKAGPIWEKASQAFADCASGDVHSFLTGGIENPGSVWARIEKPALKINPNVTDIITHAAWP
jgi:hypothetical protein